MTPAASAAEATPGRIGATYVDPHSVFDWSDRQLDSMFKAQSDAGIDTAIVQWTGAKQASGQVVTTYPANSSTGFGAFDTVLPRLLNSAQRNGVKVWLGLVLRSSLFDNAATMRDAALQDAIARDDLVIARDLLSRYAGLFQGWYIPTEPGYQTIADPTLLALHTAHFRKITDSLRSLPSALPVMVSPCVPRAIEGNLSGVDFVNRLAPMMRESGVDVWNLQGGYKMTAWSPQDSLALVKRGQEIAAETGATVWTTLYTPGPGDANYPLTPQAMFTELDAVTSTGAKATIWTFNSAMNPDATRANSAARASLYDTYRSHTG